MALSMPLVSASVKANWPKLTAWSPRSFAKSAAPGGRWSALGRPSFELTMPAVTRFPTSR